MSEPFIAQISIFGGNFAPRGWAFCDGQLLPISQYSALFSLLGTTYGGDGRTTFALPDLRGRIAMHPGHGPGLSDYRLGQKGGAETTTLTVANMPAHTHATNVTTSFANASDPNGAMLAAAAAGGEAPYAKGANVGGTLDPKASGSTGGNIPVNNLQPYACVNYIIALQGIFPSRS